LRGLTVPHTPDVQIHLRLITTEYWRIEATAHKRKYRGVGLSLGRGAVLWSYETMIPYYSASAHVVQHEVLLVKASEQLYRDTQALAAAGGSKRDLAIAYSEVERLANRTQEQYEEQLPVRGTKFLIRLEPFGSPDVQGPRHFSKTAFIITPN